MNGLPPAATHLVGDPRTGGQLDKFAVHFQFFLKHRELVLGITTPKFLHEEHVGVEF
jgi:hypothetical protein